ncbi:MAG: RNA polymerase sigma factor [Pseudomonadota bacterium]
MAGPTKSEIASVDAFVRERDDLVALARNVLNNASTAEDVVQDSWFRWAGRSYPIEDARPILRRIVINLARDLLRREKRERIGLETRPPMAELAPDAERVVIAREEVAIVVAALSELPERTLTAFRLQRIHGLTYEEIGQRLEVSTQRAFQLVRRALVHIALRMEQQQGP